MEKRCLGNSLMVANERTYTKCSGIITLPPGWPGYTLSCSYPLVQNRIFVMLLLWKPRSVLFEVLFLFNEGEISNMGE